MTDDPYQPPAAPIGPESEPTAASPDDGKATASLLCGAGSVLFSWLPLGLRSAASIADLITRAWLPFPPIILAAASLILAIIGWNSGRWPRAMFGLVLSLLGVSIVIAMTVLASVR